jgi:hypothetical protein
MTSWNQNLSVQFSNTGHETGQDDLSTPRRIHADDDYVILDHPEVNIRMQLHRQLLERSYWNDLIWSLPSR